jgi:hypothetical protein
MKHSKYGRISFHPYLASDDPNFEKKAVEIIGRYTNPMQHAFVFCMYKAKTITPAPDGLDPCRHCGFEYYRPGTLSPYACRWT